MDVKIISINGALVYSNSFQVDGNNVKQSVDVSKFATGTYFVEFTINNQKTIKSFIVR
jgi:hypothetical protein